MLRPATQVLPQHKASPEFRLPSSVIPDSKSDPGAVDEQGIAAAWQELIALTPGAAAPLTAFAAFKRLAARAGFQRYMLVDLPLALQAGLNRQDVLDNWPERFRLHYFERRLFLADPVLIAGYRERGPYFWTEAFLKHARTPEQQAIAADLADAGMKEGLVLPFGRGAAWRSVMSLARADRARPAPHIANLLHLGAHHLGTCFSASTEPAGAALLTAREREVVRWLAMGKTALETAIILELSKSTVDRHLTNARRKLSARTNAHAVALAFGRGLLFAD
jgi:LuxR family transcriptional regulator, quorum-sensing system regulator BjaR1